MTKAARATPSWLPRPPRTTIASTVADFDESEAFRTDEGLAGGEEGAREAAEIGADGEGRQLGVGDIDAERPAGHLILPQRLPRSAERQAAQAERDPVGQQSQAEDDVIEENRRAGLLRVRC